MRVSIVGGAAAGDNGPIISVWDDLQKLRGDSAFSRFNLPFFPARLLATKINMALEKDRMGKK